MVSSKMVGAVWCGRPPLCRDVYSFKILPSRSRAADTRGTSIIPQNWFFAYGVLRKSFICTGNSNGTLHGNKP
ncbi:MAG TPA: hypothetical protein VFM35_07160 [Candidatus Binatia bacterium]|nr:hypothetical protein [Candidatus Binatia bacterium]